MHKSSRNLQDSLKTGVAKKKFNKKYTKQKHMLLHNILGGPKNNTIISKLHNIDQGWKKPSFLEKAFRFFYRFSRLLKFKKKISVYK